MPALSTARVASAIAANTARLIAKVGAQPNVSIRDTVPMFGCADHHGRCKAPTAEPTMNAASVKSAPAQAREVLRRRKGRSLRDPENERVLRNVETNLLLTRLEKKRNAFSATAAREK
jgi:hypothetical protein